MNGRLENEIKKEEALLNKLKNMPDYVSEWYYNLKASNKTMTTCKDYIYKIDKFLSFIQQENGNIQLENITLMLVQKYFISIQKKNVNGNIIYTSDSYQQTVWCCLNSFFEFLFETSQIEKNFMKMISKPKNKDLERINANRILLTKKDFNKILKAVETGVGTQRARSFQENQYSRDKAIMLLFMTTGLRKSALSEINISDIDLIKGVLHIVDKGNKYHTYILSEKTIEAINEWLYEREEWNPRSNALFISNQGTRISATALSDLVDKYCQDALGYHISPHKLRAGFCSILYQETGNAEFVRRAVGHSNIATTQRYIVTDNKEREQASELIDNMLN